MKYVIVIIWFVRLYVPIINELYRVDYLTYMLTTMAQLYLPPTNVNLASYERFLVKVGKGGIKTYLFLKKKRVYQNRAIRVKQATST